MDKLFSGKLRAGVLLLLSGLFLATGCANGLRRVMISSDKTLLNGGESAQIRVNLYEYRRETDDWHAVDGRGRLTVDLRVIEGRELGELRYPTVPINHLGFGYTVFTSLRGMSGTVVIEAIWFIPQEQPGVPQEVVERPPGEIVRKRIYIKVHDEEFPVRQRTLGA